MVVPGEACGYSVLIPGIETVWPLIVLWVTYSTGLPSWRAPNAKFTCADGLVGSVPILMPTVVAVLSLLLTVTDGLMDKPVFSGWMLSTSPALSAMDHSRYDVWVLRCLTDGAPAE